MPLAGLFNLHQCSAGTTKFIKLPRESGPLHCQLEPLAAALGVHAELEDELPLRRKGGVDQGEGLRPDSAGQWFARLVLHHTETPVRTNLLSSHELYVHWPQAGIVSRADNRPEVNTLLDW